MQRFLSLLLLILSLSPFPARAEGKPLRVVATFSIIADMTKQVGGDLVQVETLIPPDSDAHGYNPKPGDSKTLFEADLIIENGLEFERWFDRLIPASGSKGEVVIASEGVRPRQMDTEGEHGHHDKQSHHAKDAKVVDPHAWQDVSNARIYVRNIADALSKARPDESGTFHARAKAYDAELEKLDRWIKAEVSVVPSPQRKIITSHDAFGYFGAAYGVVFLSPQGISTEMQPTAAEVAKLIEQMKAEKVRRVFFENMTNPKLAKQLAKDADADVGAPVYSDALSTPGGPAPTYIDMIRHNVIQFKEAMLLIGK